MLSDESMTLRPIVTQRGKFKHLAQKRYNSDLNGDKCTMDIALGFACAVMPSNRPAVAKTGQAEHT